MRVGYGRVSTSRQHQDAQVLVLEGAGCERVYVDVRSGTRDDRPELAVCMRHLRAGDQLVVPDLSRLGRSLQHLLQVAGELRERGVDLVSLREQIDSTTPQGRLTLALFASLAEFEAELIRERVLAGLDAARARGRRGGRPVKMTEEQVAAAYAMLADGKTSKAAIARVLGVARSTLYRALPG